MYDNLEHLAINIGQYVKSCKERELDPIIIIDGADSGVSPDLLSHIRNFFELITKDCKDNNMTPYIIITSNNFELVYDYEAIWVSNLERYNFKLNEYENFRNLYFDIDR